MRVIDLLGGIEVISEHECADLLRRCEIGHLATVADGIPDIAPVNYRFDGRDILIESNLGHKLLAAADAPVAFEVESIDEASRSGTSVVIRGDARVQAKEPATSDTAWSGPKDYVICIRPMSMTGRRVSWQGHRSGS